MAQDCENGGSRTHAVGFASFAAAMTSCQDHSMILCNRFDRMSTRNLLYLQSELAALQRQLDDFDREDFFDAGTDTRNIARNWEAFERAASVQESKAAERMVLVLKIRSKIKEYKEAALLDANMLALRIPSKQAFRAVDHFWMNRDNEGFPTLGGSSSSLYDDRHAISALARPLEEDRLTSFLRKFCLLLFLERYPDGNSRLVYVSTKRIALVVGLINVLLAATFLFGAIYNLYYVEQEKIKLGLIAGYTTAFALCVSLVTNARRSEIFGACAAYAAVLVVFVSGGFGGQKANATE
ncbi:uncharacterized protein Z520_06666 [Fonsecaea multimorphosa CBS 102226]|uniref:DUF6594 domain-containing protein n=1 Tax=Fonsecaea multimorphosa CBS 102226 TaxID=1442371 RepID=A0A0D2KMJ6_9EURO|nr:uncharacterized protein Z520_06666 [Fonsecaea multimorphosa CBS 102226]KIX97888.1 hypothetical protein Z520_06666 [Fonsecaea multimorphosa CBS 102226]OAL23656.1 hypothetical protein AYO22_06233 [Fonsecaea multimorphosa]